MRKIELNKYLLTGQLITKWSHNFSCQKVENKSKCDADGEGRQSLSEESQKDECETQANEDGNKTGQCGVPVAVATGLANQDAVEDEISEAEFDSSVLFILFCLHVSRWRLLRLGPGNGTITGTSLRLSLSHSSVSLPASLLSVSVPIFTESIRLILFSLITVSALARSFGSNLLCIFLLLCVSIRHTNCK